MFIVLLHDCIFGELSLLEFRLMASHLVVFFFGMDQIQALVFVNH